LTDIFGEFRDGMYPVTVDTGLQLSSASNCGMKTMRSAATREILLSDGEHNHQRHDAEQGEAVRMG